MKQLIWKLILPLTVISFGTITKWWYASPVDAPDTMYIGFPFPFVSDGWHTSFSLQYFILELIIDFLIYFLFWVIIIFIIDRYLNKINTHKFLTIGLWTISVMIIFAALFIASFSENIFHFRRAYDLEIIETGYKFIWQHTEKLNKY